MSSASPGSISEKSKLSSHTGSRLKSSRNTGGQFWSLWFAGLAITAIFHFRMSFHLHWWWGVFDSVFQLAILLVVGWRIQQFSQRKSNSPWIGGGLLTITLCPLVMQRIMRWMNTGDPVEIVALLSLQSLAVGLACLGQAPNKARLSIGLSSFQLLFVSLIFSSYPMMALQTLYAGSLLWWLMGEYWSRSQMAVPVNQRSVVPFRKSLLIGTISIISGSTLVGLLVVPGSPLYRVAGWIPFSGGERWGDEYARDGSGSGDIITGAKKNATTIAPVDTDVYLSSEQPSLYDMISKAYGKPSRQKDRKIAIDGTMKDQIRHEKKQELAASRRFSTIRNFQTKDIELAQRKSTALLFVSGAVPQHLRLETFQTYDDHEWESGPKHARYEFELDDRNATPWFRSLRPSSPHLFPLHSQLEIQIANLKTIRVPMPSLLCDWHIPQVDQPHFFEWTDDDVLQMKGRDEIPATTQIRMCSRGVNLYELYRHADWPRPDDNAGGSLESSSIEFGNVLETARRQPRGWTQIALVEDLLRRRFQYDSNALSESDQANPIDDFCRTQKGPDYLFATTAAVLLKELGYRTRLVQGLYADPREYDSRSQLTIVWDHNIHTWLEINVDGHNWIPLEPTPGFALPKRDLTWKQRVALWGIWLGRWARLNAIWLALSGLMVGGVIWQRRQLLDSVGGVGWLLIQYLGPQQQVRWCDRLVRWRLWMAGAGCPREKTLRSWLMSFSDNAAQQRYAEMQDFFELLDRVRYRQQSAAIPVQRSRSACQTALRWLKCGGEYTPNSGNDSKQPRVSSKRHGSVDLP